MEQPILRGDGAVGLARELGVGLHGDVHGADVFVLVCESKREAGSVRRVGSF